MKNVAKVAISIPITTLRSLEKARARLRKTRSAAVTEAIENWLRTDEVGDDDARYVQGYLRQPDRTADVEATATGAVASWEPWE
ncbi:MAG: hypothetical protein WKG00_24210 [Polyangiaceae bacterium]